MGSQQGSQNRKGKTATGKVEGKERDQRRWRLIPLPTPRTGEASNAFVSRCIEFLANENSSIPAGSARVAACYARLRKYRPGAVPKKEEMVGMKNFDEIELPDHLKPVNVRKEDTFSFAEKASTTNTPAWGSISHNQKDHPNKTDFIVRRGDTWSDWKLPYKYKGKIHCGGVRAAYAASRGSRGGVSGGLTPEEKSRLESARRACGFAKDLDEERPVENVMPEDKLYPLPDQPANPSIANTEWPELEEVDLPKHLQPSHERSNMEELEDMLRSP